MIEPSDTDIFACPENVQEYIKELHAEMIYADKLLKEAEGALEVYKCERCDDCQYGAGVVEDALNSAMGGKPWLTCPDCYGKWGDTKQTLTKIKDFRDDTN